MMEFFFENIVNGKGAAKHPEEVEFKTLFLVFYLDSAYLENLCQIGQEEQGDI